MVDKPAFEISGLGSDEAIERLTEFVRTQMRKPAASPFRRKWSSTDPENQFRDKLLGAIGPLVVECLARELTAEQKAALYMGILEPVMQDAIAWIPRQTVWLTEALETLSTSLVDQDGVIRVLKRLLQEEDFDYFRNIMESTSRREIEAWAAARLVGMRFWRERPDVTAMSNEQFAKFLAEYDQILEKCLGEFADEPYGPTTVGQKTERVIEGMLQSGMATEMSSHGRFRKVRTRQIRDTLKKHQEHGSR